MRSPGIIPCAFSSACARILTGSIGGPASSCIWDSFLPPPPPPLLCTDSQRLCYHTHQLVIFERVFIAISSNTLIFIAASHQTNEMLT